MSDRAWGVWLAVAASLLTSVAQLAFKLTSQHTSSGIALAWNGYLWLGVVSYFTAFVLMMRAYRLGELSLLFPLTSLCYVWNLFAGNLILHEALGPARIAGTVLIIAGSAILARG